MPDPDAEAVGGELVAGSGREERGEKMLGFGTEVVVESMGWVDVPGCGASMVSEVVDGVGSLYSNAYS